MPLSIFVIIAVYLGLYLSSLYHYLLFHSISELFSILIASTIFLIAWNARRFFDNNYFIFIGIAYLFVAGLDLIHALAYKGVGIFLGYDANLATQLWIAARYMQGLSLLIAPYFLRRILRIGPLFMAYALVTTLILASLFFWKVFPDCFIEGTGLTKFKTFSEYVICLTLLASAFAVFRYRMDFDPQVLNMVLLSIFVTVASELTFTFYANVYDIANLVGHLFKILAFFLLYKAVITTGFAHPYKLLLRNLKLSEESLERALKQSKHREHQIAALLESSKAVLKYRNFEESVRSIIDNCKRATEAAIGYISVVHKNEGEDQVIVPDSDDRSYFLDANLPIPLREIRETSYKVGEVAFYNKLKSSEHSNLVLEGHADIDNFLFAPLIISNEVVGSLGIANKPDDFDEDDARMASAFAEIASIALNNNRVLETLEHSEEELRSVVQTAADAIITIDNHGDITFWNPSAEAIFGYSSEEIIGRSAVSIIPERMREAHRKGLRRTLTSGEKTIIGNTVEMMGLNKDGHEFPVELSLTSWQTRGEPFFTAIIRNITKRKRIEEAIVRAHADMELQVAQRTEELRLQNERLQREIKERIKAETALRESETKYRIVADRTNDWEWWLDPKGLFIYVSPSCKRITGYDPEEFIADPDLIRKIILPEDSEKFRNHVEEVDKELKGGEVEFRIVRPDGSHRWISHACQPVYDETGRFLGHRGSNRDTSKRKLAENALLESERTLRFLSNQLLTIQENERKRIALELHDGINQTLAAVKFGLEKKLTKVRAKKDLDGISLENIIGLVQNGIDECRRIQMDLRPSMLDGLGIIATLSWFIREYRKIYAHIKIDMQTEIKEEDIPGEMKIIIFRIVQEAFNNISKHSKADFVRLVLKRIDSRIELLITDNGVGFDPENVRKGLGLTSMSERTRLSRGRFLIESAQGAPTMIKATWSLQKLVKEKPRTKKTPRT